MAKLEPLWLHLDRLSSRLKESPTLSVAVDYDGTLTPIMSHPDEARLSPRARQAVERLAGAPGARVAVLSGRAIDDLRTRLGMAGVFLSGDAGLETEDEKGNRLVHVPEDRRIPPQLRTELEQWCARFSGAWLEDKNHTLALHYRNVPHRFQGAFGAGVRRRVRPLAGIARLVHGKKVFEVMPAVPWSKADALDQWWAGQGMLFSFGDDTHDEPVHARVAGHGGVAVAVGRLVSKAPYVLRDPDDVVWFLEWLDREWRDLHPAHANGAPSRPIPEPAMS